MLPKVMILQHDGGEYAAVNLSGLKNRPDEAWDILADIGERLRRPSTTGNVGLHVYDTVLDRPTVERIGQWLSEAAPRIDRLVFIGATPSGKRRLRREIRRRELSVNHAFLFDWDASKDWLVGKR